MNNGTHSPTTQNRKRRRTLASVDQAPVNRPRPPMNTGDIGRASASTVRLHGLRLHGRKVSGKINGWLWPPSVFALAELGQLTTPPGYYIPRTMGMRALLVD